MDPLQLSTTMENGAYKTTTPEGRYPSLTQGAPMAGGPGAAGGQPPMFGGVLSMLLKRKTDAADWELRRQQQLAAQQDEDRMRARQYTPSLGAAPKREEISRFVRDPYATGYEQYANPGAKPNMVKERYIDGKWEFDNLDPRRQGGGGKGEISTGKSASETFQEGEARLNKIRDAEKSKSSPNATTGRP